MAVGIGKDIVDLLRREKRQLAEFFVGRSIEVDRGIVQGIEVGLQLFVVGFSQLGCGTINIENDIIEGREGGEEYEEGASHWSWAR